jgi:short-subunit dehydrogenase
MLATTPKMLPAEKCAEQILRGVERNRAIIVVRGMAKFFWVLHRLSPTLVMWFIRKVHTKKLREVRIAE